MHKNKQAGLAPIAIILIIAGVLIIGGGVLYYLIRTTRVGPGLLPSSIGCTQEAKQCPDGSYVARTGPNCEFAACLSPASISTSSIDTSSWKTYRNEKYGFEFKYPSQYSIKTDSTTGSDINGNYSYVDLINNSDHIIAQVWENGVSPEGSIRDHNEITKTEINKIGDITATKLTGDSGVTAKPMEVTIYSLNGKSFIFNTPVELLNQILSTFKFISENIQTVTVQDLIKHPEQFLGKEVRVSGKLMLTSKSYFPNPEVGISDGINIFPVSQWLPTEIPPSPPNQGNANQPVTMQYYLNKNLTLRGIVKSGDIYPKRGVIMYLDVTTVE